MLLESIIDSDDVLILDAGFDGKKFEDVLLQAFNLVGLKFEKNSRGGKGWDFKPIGKKWLKLIDSKLINIKVARTKWLFGGAEFGKIFDWDNLEEKDVESAKKKFKGLLTKNGVSKLLFLKPKDIVIQRSIVEATKAKDIKKLNDLLQKKNFGINKLGTSFEIKFFISNKRVNSVAILKSGKVFMRTDRPRRVGGSKSFVGFKKDSIVAPKQPKNVINKSENLIEKISKFLEV